MWSRRPLGARAGPRRCGRRLAALLGARPGPLADAEQLAADDRDRVVLAIDHALLQRDDAVVGDADVLGADLGAAPRDVAQARAELLADLGDAVVGVERVHLQAGQPDHEARAVERPGGGAAGAGRLGLERGLVAVAQDVADVLAQEALDALAELLHPVDVFLVHAVGAVGVARPRLE